jgi:hypothetical protein
VLPADGAASWGEEIIISTHLRIAASVCVLSTALMVGSSGGAIATADTDTSGSTTTTSVAGDPSPTSTPTRGPIMTFADNVRKQIEMSLVGTVQMVTGAFNPPAKPGESSGIPKSPPTTFGGSPTVHGSSVSEGAPTDDVTPASEVTPAAEVAPPAELAPAPEATPASEVTPPSETNVVVAPPTAPPMPLGATVHRPDPMVMLSKLMNPMTNAVTTVAGTIFLAPGVLLALPTSATPVADVLTYFQTVLASVSSAGAFLAQVPGDLITYLGTSTTIQAPTVGAATGLPRLRAITGAPETAPGWSAVPLLPSVFLPGVEVAPAIDKLPVPLAPLDVTTTGTGGGQSSPVSALMNPRGDVLSMVEHVIGAIVATVSLTALAAMALPGLLGLLTTCAAGIRVGYRQAKAGSALPDTKISRFIGSGPIGVVRSNSQVQLRSRPSHTARPAVKVAGRTRALYAVGSESPATQLLEQAV